MIEAMEKNNFDETIRNEPSQKEGSAIEETENEIRSKAEAIATATSFPELYEILRALESIKGKDPDVVIGVISSIESGKIEYLQAVTRTYDLCKKVQELFFKKHPVEGVE